MRGRKDRDCSKSSDKVHILIVSRSCDVRCSLGTKPRGKLLSLSTRRLLETFEKESVGGLSVVFLSGDEI